MYGSEWNPREREVLELVAEGRSNQGIAKRLVITERAVQKHATNILKHGLAESSDDHRRGSRWSPSSTPSVRRGVPNRATAEVRFAYLQTPAGSIGARPAHGHRRVASRYKPLPGGLHVPAVTTRRPK
jgi:hypothetical protein